MHNDNRRSGGFNGGGFVPVKVDQELDVKIEAVGAKGDGIAKVQGFVLFVPGGKEGEEVHIKITKVLRNVGFAEVMGKATGAVGATPAPDQPKEPQDSENFGEDSQEETDTSEDLEQ